MKLVLCLPGNNFSGKFLDSLFVFYSWCIQNQIQLFVSRQESCNIYYVRNLCLGGQALAGKNQKPWQGTIDYDYMLWIDSDIIFNPNDFIKLYNMNVDVASGLYLMDCGKDSSLYAAVEVWDENYFEQYGHFEFVTKESLKEKTAPFPVNYCGFGFILIKRGVAESISYPFFEPKYSKIGNCYDFSMEDVAFCHKMIEKGYTIWCNPEVIVGHEKKIILI